MSDISGLTDRAILLFNAARYFEAHELFEDLWRASTGERRLAYQGLVQVCAGLVKHQRGQPGPAVTLLARGLAKVSSSSSGCQTGLDLDRLAAGVRCAIDALQAGLPFDPPVMARARQT